LVATLALSIYARMQRDFTNPSYIFLYFWWVLFSLTATLQNALKHV